MTLREHIALAEEKGSAIGHFNISNIEGFWAVVNASRKLKVPVIIGVSEGERDFIGIKQIKALVETVQADGLPVFLNADHTYSIDRVKEVVEARYDAVIIDEADKNFEENIKITKEAVIYAKSVDQKILVEGELGFIGKSSRVLDDLPQGISWTDTNEARQFTEETQVDLFAPAVGNIHGMIKGGQNPKLDIKLLKEIKEAVKIPLVLHGGSGISDDGFKDAIAAGISVIHVNTELRIAYKKGLQLALSENVDEITPYKYLKVAMQEMQEVVERKLILFNNL